MEQKSLTVTLQPPPCQRHNMREYCKYFCKECNELMCPNCLRTEQHRYHQIIEYREYFQEQKQITEKQFRKAKNLLSSIKELQKSISRSKKEHQQKCDKDDGEVEIFHRKVRTDFDEWYKRKIMELQDTKRVQVQAIGRARDEMKQLACSGDSINIVEDRIQSHVENAWASIVIPEIKVKKTELQRTIHKYSPQLRFSFTRHQGLYDTLSPQRQLRPTSFPEYSNISLLLPPPNRSHTLNSGGTFSISEHPSEKNDSVSFSSVNTSTSYCISPPIPSNHPCINDSLKRAPNNFVSLHNDTLSLYRSESLLRQPQYPTYSPLHPPDLSHFRTLSSERTSSVSNQTKNQRSEGTSLSSSMTSAIMPYSVGSASSSNQSIITITAESLKKAPNDFVNPYDVCITPQQDIIISDPSSHCLRVLNIDKGSLVQVHVIDCGECEPSTIAYNSETNKLLMVDRKGIGESHIKRINLAKSHLPRNFPFSAIKCPGGLAFGYDTDHKMYAYIMDTVDGSVYIVNNKGKVRNKISMQPMVAQSSSSLTTDSATSISKMNARPVSITTGLAYDTYGSNPYFIVADINNCCIRKFSLHTEMWSSKQMENQQKILKHPFAVTTITKGITAVADPKNHRVSFFSPKGTLLSHLGDETTLSNPRSIAYCDKKQCLVVLDDGDKKVKIFFLQDVYGKLYETIV